MANIYIYNVNIFMPSAYTKIRKECATMAKDKNQNKKSSSEQQNKQENQQKNQK